MMSSGTAMRCTNNLLNFLVGVVALLILGVIPAGGQTEPHPHVIVIGVNGMEWDIVRPLLLRGELAQLCSSYPAWRVRQNADTFRPELSQDI